MADGQFDGKSHQLLGDVFVRIPQLGDMPLPQRHIPLEIYGDAPPGTRFQISILQPSIYTHPANELKMLKESLLAVLGGIDAQYGRNSYRGLRDSNEQAIANFGSLNRQEWIEQNSQLLHAEHIPGARRPKQSSQPEQSSQPLPIANFASLQTIYVRLLKRAYDQAKWRPATDLVQNVILNAAIAKHAGGEKLSLADVSSLYDSALHENSADPMASSRGRFPNARAVFGHLFHYLRSASNPATGAMEQQLLAGLDELDLRERTRWSTGWDFDRDGVAQSYEIESESFFDELLEFVHSQKESPDQWRLRALGHGQLFFATANLKLIKQQMNATMLYGSILSSFVVQGEPQEDNLVLFDLQIHLHN